MNHHNSNETRKMYQALLTSTTFFYELFKHDEKIAAQVQQNGCQCGGVLHVANYPRVAKGMPELIGSNYRLRLSFCCNQQGCRKRVTPPTLRFLGRKVYISIIIILTFMLPAKTTTQRIDQLQACIGLIVSDETTRRWQQWWFCLPDNLLWKKQGLGSTIDRKNLPDSLLTCFAGKISDQLFSTLKFLSPLTTTFTFIEGKTKN
jgi:hypothetical protein